MQKFFCEIVEKQDPKRVLDARVKATMTPQKKFFDTPKKVLYPQKSLLTKKVFLTTHKKFLNPNKKFPPPSP